MQITISNILQAFCSALFVYEVEVIWSPEVPNFPSLTLNRVGVGAFATGLGALTLKSRVHKTRVEPTITCHSCKLPLFHQKECHYITENWFNVTPLILVTNCMSRFAIANVFQQQTLYGFIYLFIFYLGKEDYGLTYQVAAASK